jgi:hypothetical protein
VSTPLSDGGLTREGEAPTGRSHARQGAHDRGRITEEPCDGKRCAAGRGAESLTQSREVRRETSGPSDSPEGESRRGQAHVGKARGIGRRLRCGPARPARYGESSTACTPIPSGATGTPIATASTGDAVRSGPFTFRGLYPPPGRRSRATRLKGMNGAPTSRSIRSAPPERGIASGARALR